MCMFIRKETNMNIDPFILPLSQLQTLPSIQTWFGISRQTNSCILTGLHEWKLCSYLFLMSFVENTSPQETLQWKNPSMSLSLPTSYLSFTNPCCETSCLCIRILSQFYFSKLKSTLEAILFGQKEQEWVLWGNHLLTQVIMMVKANPLSVI